MKPLGTFSFLFNATASPTRFGHPEPKVCKSVIRSVMCAYYSQFLIIIPKTLPFIFTPIQTVLSLTNKLYPPKT